MKKLPIVLLAVLMVIFTFDATAQTGRSLKTLTGKVLEESGEPLIGAAVMVSGTKIGTTTDLDGNYSIQIDKDKTVPVEYSFIGMKTETILITPSTLQYNVVLKSDNSLEAAVVSSGYGIQQHRENLTGAITEVSSEMIAKLPANRVDKLLDGLVAGLEVNSNSTTVRTSYQLRVRGDGSLSASKEPLWIVDGVPIYTGDINNNVTGTSYTVSPLSFMNPDDIESISVLKDAGTTAIYGADGANGVILVTTKKAKEGTINIRASMKYGISRLDRSTITKYLNGPQYLELALEGWVNAGYSASIFPYQDNEYNSYSTTDTDWIGIYAGTGTIKQANLSMSSGTEKVQNYFSLSWLNDKNVYIGNEQSRFSVRDNINYKFNDKLSSTITLEASFNDNDIFSVSASSVLRNLPIFDPYNEDGSYRIYNYYSRSTTEYNLVPVTFFDNDLPERDDDQNNQRTLSAGINARLSYKPIKSLELTSQTGFSTLSTYERYYSTRNSVSSIASGEDLRGSSRRSGVFNYILTETLRANYNATIGLHRITGMAGIEWTDKLNGYLNATGSGFASDNMKEINYANDETIDGASNSTHTRSISYMAMGVYTFNRKYTVSASYRRQGYSSFSTYSQWGNFASIGINWNAYAETWVKDALNPYVTSLNVKASYGNNGNSRVDTSSSYGTYSVSTGSYYGGVSGGTQSAAANPGLSWEKARIFNAGISAELFDRVNINVDGYYKYTDDVLYKGRVSSIITDASIVRNVGAISNKGIEFDIRAKLIDTQDFGWTMTLNGAHNANKIEKLYKDTYSGFFDYVWTKGASKDALWLVRWAGVDPSDGSPLWYDINGNLTRTFSYSDRVLLPQYSNKPTVYGGLTETFRYKNWTLDMKIKYKIGGWTFEGLNSDGSSILEYNYPVEAMDHWRQPGDVSKNPKWMYENYRYTSTASTRDIYRMTSLQLSNVSIDYDLPGKLVEKIGVKTATVSLVGDNLYFWTPGQKKDKNSYKTIAFSGGLIRSFSAQLSVAF